MRISISCSFGRHRGIGVPYIFENSVGTCFSLASIITSNHNVHGRVDKSGIIFSNSHALKTSILDIVYKLRLDSVF